MMKRFFSFCVIAFMAMNVMATEPNVVLNFTDSVWNFPTSYVTTAESYTNGVYTVTFGESNNGHKILTSGGSITGIIFGKLGATLTLPAINNLTLDSMIVNGLSGASGKVTFSIFVDEVNVADTVTSSKVSHTFVMESPYNAPGTVYTIKITNGNNVQISTIEFYGEENIDTSIDNSNAQGIENTKFINNGRMYIKRNGIIYDAFGNKVD